MMYRKYVNFWLLAGSMLFMVACTNTKKTTYFNNAQDAVIVPNLSDTIMPIIQKNDILSITITSPNEKASALFNLPNSSFNSSTITSTNGQSGAGYLVNSEGYIQVPGLGAIKVAGRTSNEVKNIIIDMLTNQKLLLDPIVNIRHLNYEVTVLGEVGKPAVINVPSEKISLLKAIGLAGDITIFGKKDNVLLIREISGKRVVKRVNLNEASFLTSPYYYLQPNDLVYVEANKDKVALSSSFRQSLPTLLSALSVVLITIQLIKK
ncbi:polysaccharide biosynthesis/export family protein [Ferruginibacter paludis]|uniref:polysaccharide biosynthesis/export family protein n=1 Tax=Ferruginibacter paludis TaxID=1310417 RepID=UPI0025B2E5E1|nr:polysaccharide biosynthesis/export family protein [Ferruginibacter paludis]MDN3655846.1 polysaccharide biosynthesis/export family protein [Ferruginibacter paludis]